MLVATAAEAVELATTTFALFVDTTTTADVLEELYSFSVDFFAAAEADECFEEEDLATAVLRAAAADVFETTVDLWAADEVALWTAAPKDLCTAAAVLWLSPRVLVIVAR